MRVVFFLILTFFHSLSMGMYTGTSKFTSVIVTPVPNQSIVLGRALPQLSSDVIMATISNGVAAEYRTLNVQDATEVVRLAFSNATRQGLDPYLVVAIIAAESGFQRRVVSAAGAKGFMQVMDKVHNDKVKGRNPFDTKVNLEVGVKILSDCFKRHTTSRRALGCYNGANTTKSIDRYYKKITLKKGIIQTLASLVGVP